MVLSLINSAYSELFNDTRSPCKCISIPKTPNMTNLAYLSLPAGTSMTSALPDYPAFLTLLRGGTRFPDTPWMYQPRHLVIIKCLSLTCAVIKQYVYRFRLYYTGGSRFFAPRGSADPPVYEPFPSPFRLESSLQFS